MPCSSTQNPFSECLSSAVALIERERAPLRPDAAPPGSLVLHVAAHSQLLEKWAFDFHCDVRNNNFTPQLTLILHEIYLKLNTLPLGIALKSHKSTLTKRSIAIKYLKYNTSVHETRTITDFHFNKNAKLCEHVFKSAETSSASFKLVVTYDANICDFEKYECVSNDHWASCSDNHEEETNTTLSLTGSIKPAKPTIVKRQINSDFHIGETNITQQTIIKRQINSDNHTEETNNTQQTIIKHQINSDNCSGETNNTQPTILKHQINSDNCSGETNTTYSDNHTEKTNTTYPFISFTNTITPANNNEPTILNRQVNSDNHEETNTTYPFISFTNTIKPTNNNEPTILNRQVNSPIPSPQMIRLTIKYAHQSFKSVHEKDEDSHPQFQIPGKVGEALNGNDVVVSYNIKHVQNDNINVNPNVIDNSLKNQTFKGLGFRNPEHPIDSIFSETPQHHSSFPQEIPPLAPRSIPRSQLRNSITTSPESSPDTTESIITSSLERLNIENDSIYAPRSSRRDSIYSTSQSSDYFGSFIGSYETSLLSGRMSTNPSKPVEFLANIGVIGLGKCKPNLKCPEHLNVLFNAYYYDLKEQEGPTPYVGTIDFDEVDSQRKLFVHYTGLSQSAGDVCTQRLKSVINNVYLNQTVLKGYRIPFKGQLQIMIRNIQNTSVKVFLVPYDFKDMPVNSKTFIRQKVYGMSNTVNDFSGEGKLQYAIHVTFINTEKNKLFMMSGTRVVFVSRKDSFEQFKNVTTGPENPKYSHIGVVPSLYSSWDHGNELEKGR